ncbi:MAG: NAD-dependent epimerase/dehydratase family protein [Chlorobium sp.]
MSETILVTGSTGFIGARLLQKLSEEGEKIRIFLRSESRVGALPDSVEIVRGSFGDVESLAEAVRGTDRIIHLAGVTKAPDEAGYLAGNVMPARHLLAAVKLYNPALKRFVYVSSLTAVGPASEGIHGVKESDPPRPVSAYGRSKLQAETVCMEHSAQIPLTIVRPPAVYGPGDKDVLQVFLMLSRGLLVSPGKAGKQRFSMIYVDDLVDGIMMAARSPQAAGRVYNITSPCSWSWDDVITAAQPVLGFSRLWKVSLPRSLLYLIGTVIGAAGLFGGTPPLINRDKVNELVQDYWVCSPVQAQQDFGFTARTTLVDGISKTIEWYRLKGWL